MKNITKHLLFAAIGFSAITFQSCKGKNKDTKDAIVNIDSPATAPVQIAIDDELTNKAKDAIKDFNGVSATVANGEITLTGNIKRDKLQTLMQTINALHAKKINNKLTITN
ncbi:hypothetical protein EZ428_07810 [Pedobacter frigiditerrae]|uniref:BON domain-containing protein n=1 Tax=Pedobacter frigiditerrae TaxID=2530452 RepID=A0A4R0MXP4_9SPHI|nr:hypothetical protein [Pedobacter frigiditerrae]TCC91657.1 hypothetical protein EZ428_07810 [Pedobacter frigiditerrae]